MDLVKYLNNNQKIFMLIYKNICLNDTFNFFYGFYQSFENDWFFREIK